MRTSATPSRTSSPSSSNSFWTRPRTTWAAPSSPGRRPSRSWRAGSERDEQQGEHASTPECAAAGSPPQPCCSQRVRRRGALRPTNWPGQDWARDLTGRRSPTARSGRLMPAPTTCRRPPAAGEALPSGRRRRRRRGDAQAQRGRRHHPRTSLAPWPRRRRVTPQRGGHRLPDSGGRRAGSVSTTTSRRS